MRQALCMVVVALGATHITGADPKPFLDEVKKIPARKEWNREIVLKQRPGTVGFRVKSGGPFAVTVLSEKAYKALLQNDPKSFSKDEVYLTIDSKESSLEKDVKLPKGSFYFIIENQTDNEVEIRLEC